MDSRAALVTVRSPTSNRQPPRLGRRADRLERGTGDVISARAVKERLNRKDTVCKDLAAIML